MIAAAKRAGFFKRQNIGRLFDDAEKLGRARRVRTDVAKLVRCEVTAKFAGMNSFARFRNRPSKSRGRFRKRAKEFIPANFAVTSQRTSFATSVRTLLARPSFSASSNSRPIFCRLKKPARFAAAIIR